MKCPLCGTKIKVKTIGKGMDKYEPVVDRDKLKEIILPYTRGLWSCCMVNKDDMCSEGMVKHIETLESELADAIHSAQMEKLGGVR